MNNLIEFDKARFKRDGLRLALARCLMALQRSMLDLNPHTDVPGIKNIQKEISKLALEIIEKEKL